MGKQLLQVTGCFLKKLPHYLTTQYFTRRKNMGQYENEVETLLRQLGANGSYVGFRYALYGICRVHQDPELTTYICKGLYTEIALHFHTTVSSAERNIRTLVRIIWEHGDRNRLNEIFYRELPAKPTNAAFIDAVARYTENLYCRMGDNGISPALFLPK